MDLEVVTVGENGVTEKDVLVHDATRDDPTLAFMLANMSTRPGFPTPIGVFRAVRRPTVEEMTWEIIEATKQKKGPSDLRALLSGGDTWEIA
jgi:2-oxoglutarate ferredoxin oxidoreductase subunit beta